jgi:hypothetical protein
MHMSGVIKVKKREKKCFFLLYQMFDNFIQLWNDRYCAMCFCDILSDNIFYLRLNCDILRLYPAFLIECIISYHGLTGNVEIDVKNA